MMFKVQPWYPSTLPSKEELEAVTRSYLPDDGTRFWHAVERELQTDVYAEDPPSFVSATLYFTAREALYAAGYGRDLTGHPRNPLHRTLSLCHVQDPYAQCRAELELKCDEAMASIQTSVDEFCGYEFASNGTGIVEDWVKRLCRMINERD